MEKFPGAFQRLKNHPQIEIEEVSLFPREHIERVHRPSYLNRVNFDDTEHGHCGLTRSERHRLGLPARENLLYRSMLETSGTILAAETALKEGIAANLAGGTHHAFPDRGLGFCVLNDVAVAIRGLQKDRPNLHFLVLDTDAHQGNGTHAIFREDPHVFTYSIHVGRNYPAHKEPGDMDVPLPRWVEGKQYWEAFAESSASAFDRTEPDLVFWIAGADPHHEDRFGQMTLTDEDFRRRDRHVWKLCREFNCPVVVLYGGGYNRKRGKTAALHAATLETLAAIPK
ncbi:MAG: histone deacetylase [Opitutales bacterium]|nr:histone deacetylase [Opitutales bacterium]MCH8541242.1 histone deacetylase [Opitutales bacterium]